MIVTLLLYILTLGNNILIRYHSIKFRIKNVSNLKTNNGHFIPKLRANARSNKS
ncbi:hypothetical protein GCM10028895_19910 [Pontibacter rugosus]